jgi:hypothetical protein
MREITAMMMKEAFHKAATICFMASAGDDPLAKEATTSLMSSVDGAIEMLWHSARKNHPGITKKEIERLLDDPSTDMKSLLEDVMKASGQEPFRVGEVGQRGSAQGSSPAPLQIAPG